MRNAETVLNVIREHGSPPAQDAGSLPRVPCEHTHRAPPAADNGMTTGEPDALKGARLVRRGADGKVQRDIESTRRQPTRPMVSRNLQTVERVAMGEMVPSGRGLRPPASGRGARK